MHGHPTDQCPQLIENGGWESANAVGYQGQNQPRYDPFSNTYNPGWRDHPNLKWREPQQQQGGYRQPPPGLYQRPFAPAQPRPQTAQSNSGSPLDNDKMLQVLTSLTQGLQNQAKEMSEVKKQIGQMTEFMGQFREEGKLPSSTIVNPKGGFETAKAIILRSGKEIGTNPKMSKQNPKENEKLLLKEKEVDKATAREEQPLLQSPKAPTQPNSDLCTTRRRISNKEVVRVSENVSAVLQRKLPPKCKDPGSFTIPCVIGNTKFEHAMLDLGASINVMPYSIYASMNLGEPKNDGVIIQLADCSNAYPKGVLEDVLVQVNHFIFPADFYVLEMEDLAHSTPLPILLGRPFMKTARTKIDVFKGTLTMEFDGNIIDFNISEAIRYPIDDHSCFSIDAFDFLAQEYLESLDRDVLETTIVQGIELIKNRAEPHHEEIGEMVAALESLPQYVGKPPIPIPIPVSTNKLLPSVIQAPTLELKPLPNHLNEEEKLVRVLQEYKTAIGWTLADIKGLSPTTCMHRILLEEGAKPTREAQRRLNPPMMEVVKKEIIKLLDCGVIYPISDSRWVSPVEVVPKKSGVTVVKNEENELVPTRIQTGWRVCIDYRKLNATTRKDHFPLPFIDQMLERLAGHYFYCFLDGYSGYNQIVIAPDDQEKTTFTCPFGTFAYRRMPFGLCNAPATFQRCMDVPFVFDDKCEKAFNHLKELLTSAPIIVPPNWSLPFELMCDASDYALGAVLGQRKDKKPHIIYYASRTLNDAQLNYSTTEKELLVVVFALDKFRSYLLGPDGKIGKKGHFGAFWSSFGLVMDSICMGQDG
ncbi:unnamed protein product [Prunus armeniaca]